MKRPIFYHPQQLQCLIYEILKQAWLVCLPAGRW